MDDDERFMTTAWHIGYFGRVSRMPPLAEVLAPYRKPRKKKTITKDAAPVVSDVDPNMARNLMNALLQFPAGTVPGERSKPPPPSEAPPA